MAYIALLFSGLLIIIDQLIKSWVSTNLVAQGSITVIPKLLSLTYVENYGAAYGIMNGKTNLLIIVTTIVLITMIVVLLSKKINHKLAITSISLIVAGGFGNLIDRISKGYVVDYLDVNNLFSFPVFNFADCCVVIGTIFLVVYILFFEDKKQKTQESPKTEIEEN